MISFSEWLEPLHYVVDPSKRLFFLYLLTAATMASVLMLSQRQSLSKVFQSLFHPKVWLHRSTKIDFQLMFFNSVFKAGLFLAVSVSAVMVAKMVMRGLYQLNPDQETFNLGFAEGMVLYTIVSFVVIDFFRYFQHYLFHKIPFLWRFHKIHHAAEVMTPVTLYRTHPLESLISALRQILVLGVISGVFLFYTRSLITAYAIFGVNALDFIFNTFGSNLRHSHVWLSFGPLNYVFVSPAQHQIHHSRAEKHFDKNLGFSLSLWDLLFGTFYQVKKREFLIFGVRGEKYQTLWQALKAPWKSPSRAEASKKAISL